MQTLLVQSFPVTQLFPSAQVGQVPPPQSTAVSVPFFTASLHVAAWQTFPVHTPLLQSEATLHTLPALHPGQLPPQSVAVSVPFLTESVQVGAWHTLLEQTPLVQSLGALQPWPVAQAPHVPPPQSTPVSAPFLILSLQVGA